MLDSVDYAAVQKGMGFEELAAHECHATEYHSELRR